MGKLHKAVRFFSRNLLARRGWHDVLKMLKGKYLQPRILYPPRLSFRIEEEEQEFPRQKL